MSYQILYLYKETTKTTPQLVILEGDVTFLLLNLLYFSGRNCSEILLKCGPFVDWEKPRYSVAFAYRLAW